MDHVDTNILNRKSGSRSILFLCSLLMLLPFPASAFQLTAVRADGSVLNGYRWQVVEDSTHAVEPGVASSASLSFGLHSSSNRVVANGHAAGSIATVNVPDDRRYFVSILPDIECPLWGGALCSAAGGQQVNVGDSEVTVTVSGGQLPSGARIPTAQLSIVVFEDTKPLNGAHDFPAESADLSGNSPMGGFTIELDDGYGRVQQDVFGNLLGTTYQKNPDGSFASDEAGDPIVATVGTGIILTDAEGHALIKNMYPGKYGINAVSPGNTSWQQTSTIEGKKTIDAWIKANEPPFFQEFGIPGYHASFGFVRPLSDIPEAPGATKTTIAGTVVGNHLNRPPYYSFSPGAPIANCWVGLNDIALGEIGEALYIEPCDGDSGFAIPDVPPGTYQLAIFDSYLDVVFAALDVVVSPDAPATTDLGEVMVFQWFGRTEHYVFYDSDRDGFPDPGEPGLPEQGINLRHRDGTVYQSFPTDLLGTVPFDEVFPFFHWLVAEVDFMRFDATGVTISVDAGGPADSNPVLDAWLGEATDPVMNMQGQPENGGLGYRTETGAVLTQGFQAFMGQTNRFFWGKSIYPPGANGGVSGMVLYAVTRAEDDPRYAAGEEWEPGVARAVVNLYQDSNADGIIDDLDGNEISEPSDVDNYPFGNFPSIEDIDRNFNFIFDSGDAIATTSTDSWDDNLPTGCVGEDGVQINIPTADGGTSTDCFEGLRTFNQVRPALFDGGYAFVSYHPGGISSGSDETEPIPSGTYIVESVPPPLYLTVAEEHKNVDYGDLWTPSTLLLPPVCVGDLHTVPDNLTLFPGQAIEAPYAGQQRPLCDRKQVTVRGGGFNAAADFFVTTEVPLPGRAVGIVMDDLGNEFDATSPNFAEKYAPPYLPVAFYDWRQEEPFSRVYTDEFGAYNALVPATHNVNLPSASGVSPFMATICINDPGPIEDPNNPGQMITDPYYNPQYSRFCYTFNFNSGTTTYLDTPVVPTAAFAGGSGAPLDCQVGDGAPKIQRVDGPGNSGPVASTGQTLTIQSVGDFSVRNPAYGNAGEPMLITRDFGFGASQGEVTIGGVAVPSVDISWSPDSISFPVPEGASTGQLLVTRGDNDETTEVGITVTINPVQLVLTVPQGGSIQDTIDAAPENALIIVPAGTYNENVIVDRGIQLQGNGAGSTTINGSNLPTSRAVEWRDAIQAKIEAGDSDLLPNQEAPGVGNGGGWETNFVAEEAPVIIVVPAVGEFAAASIAPRIDGFSLTNAEVGGGILVNGYADGLQISNNSITNNVGVFGGGIRVGRSDVEGEIDGQNDNISIFHNDISLNAGSKGPGGVALFAGSDNFSLRDNWICGNFTTDNGAGVGKIGLSDGGRIEGNTIIFNEAWNGTLPASGGGIQVAGNPGLEGALSNGTGSTQIVNNVIQGNSAGTGDGGGISLENVNGVDVEASPSDSSTWYKIELFNNMITNNVAGNAGAVSLRDSANVVIANNTVANNDSTATAAAALNPDLQSSNPRGAGVVSYAHSTTLASAMGTVVGPEAAEFSNPRLVNNIIWHNRSFSWETPMGSISGHLVPDPSTPNYADLEVFGLGADTFLNPDYSVLSDINVPGAGYDDGTNVDGDPQFLDEYSNGPRGVLVEQEFKALTGPIPTAVAFDEGGNFIDIEFGPLTLIGDYHVGALSSAVALEANEAVISEYADLATDIDGDARLSPTSGWVEAGADEYRIAAGNLCGLGFEAVLIVPILQWSLRRRRRSRIRQQDSLSKEMGQ
jgi:hypothetical protein